MLIYKAYEWHIGTLVPTKISIYLHTSVLHSSSMNIHFRVPAARAGRRGTTPAPARPRNPGAGQLRARPAAAPQLRPSSQLQLWPGAWRGSWARPARRAPAPSTSPPRRSTASTTPPRWVPDLADSYTECTAARNSELWTGDRLLQRVGL